MWWYDDFGWMGWIVTGLVSIVVLGVLALVGIAVSRALGQGEPRRSGLPDRTPEQVLDDRLARGEIDEDEYERRRALLRSAR